jgi:hypothetical protein
VKLFLFFSRRKDLFFEGDDEFDLREKYSYLKGNIDLWCRDEAHKYYVGNRTSNLLNIIQERAVLDMTATPYKIIGKLLRRHDCESQSYVGIEISC